MYNGPIRKYLRLQNYDYSQNGFYYITICTKDRENYFGEIIDGNVILNDYGKIAENFWLEIPNHFPKSNIGEFVIMPNHIHGIIIIKNESLGNENVGNENFRSLLRDINHITNLSNIVKGFKIGFTKEIRQKYNDFVFGWQKSFFDKIIRNEEQLQKTREYILNNPLKWEIDVNNKKNEELVKRLRKEMFVK